MEKITMAGAPDDVATTELRDLGTRSGARKDDLRTLSDLELLLAGGGDDVPGWSPPH